MYTMLTPQELFVKHKNIIIDLTYPDIICEHVGGSAIPGALYGK